MDKLRNDIKTWKKINNKTDTYIWKLSGISRAYFSEIMSGKKMPTLGMILKICKVINKKLVIQ